jgi:membrane protein DedA with SNARE-associated domain
MNYYLLHTTYSIAFLAVLGRQLCLPVPALLFLLSAGALGGGDQLSLARVLAVAVLGCLVATRATAFAT